MAKHSCQVEIETDVEPEAKKHSLTVQTVKTWVLENEKILGTSTWLAFNNALDHTIVTSLKCSVCIQFEEKLRGRNFNPVFIVGSTNLRASSFKDHADTDMHVHAMLLYKKAFQVVLFIALLLLRL